MQGLVHALKPKRNGGWCRRVIVKDTVSLPARCETDVTGQVVYRDLKYPWTTVPRSPFGEVRVARTVLSSCWKGSPCV